MIPIQNNLTLHRRLLWSHGFLKFASSYKQVAPVGPDFSGTFFENAHVPPNGIDSEEFSLLYKLY
jgi:hypothetical protein